MGYSGNYTIAGKSLSLRTPVVSLSSGNSLRSHSTVTVTIQPSIAVTSQQIEAFIGPNFQILKSFINLGKDSL